jgi:hypothetical protein
MLNNLMVEMGNKQKTANSSSTTQKTKVSASGALDENDLSHKLVMLHPSYQAFENALPFS